MQCIIYTAIVKPITCNTEITTHTTLRLMCAGKETYERLVYAIRPTSTEHLSLEFLHSMHELPYSLMLNYRLNEGNPHVLSRVYIDS